MGVPPACGEDGRNEYLKPLGAPVHFSKMISPEPKNIFSHACFFWLKKEKLSDAINQGKPLL